MAEIQNKTVTSDRFPVNIGGEKFTAITRTDYKVTGGTITSSGGADVGSQIKLYQEVSAEDYNKLSLPDDEKFITGVFVSASSKEGGDDRKFYKLVGEYNTDGSKKWSTTSQTPASLTNEMLNYNGGKGSATLSNALKSSSKTVARAERKSEAEVAPIIQKGKSAEQRSGDQFISSLVNAPTKPGTKNTQGAFGSNMRYPTNMSANQDKIKIDMIKFTPRALTTTGSGLSDRDTSNQSIIGSVTLAIPGGIRDDNRVNWGSQDMNIAQARLGKLALDMIAGGKEATTKGFKDVMSDIGGNDKIKSAVALGFAGQAVGAQGLLTRTSGAVLNPNTELLFSGPALRAFTFQFPFSPRSQKESEEVQRIIRFFKQGMAVQRTDDSIFLKAPNIFKLKFLNGNAEHKFLPKIKVCALLNCSVDYTPDGNYSTYTNSSMTNYTMSLTFNELDPLYNDEYTGKGESTTTNNIGF